MKVLAVSDLHIDASSMPGGSFRDPARVRDLNIELCVNEIFPAIDRLIEEEEVDLLVTTGDVFDSSRPTLKAIAAVRSWVASLSIPSVHITGNHELIGLSRYDDDILDYALGDIPLATIVSEPEVIDGMAMVPWPTHNDWASYIDSIPSADVMFGHLELDDVVDYSSKGINSATVAKKWPIAILGHYHKRTLSEGNTVGYIGSVKPPRYASGETEMPAIGVAIVENGTVRIVDIPCSRRCRKVPAEELTDEFIADLSPSDAVVVVGQSDRLHEIRAAGALVSVVLPPVEKPGHITEEAPVHGELKEPMDYVREAVDGDKDALGLIDFFSEFFSL